MDELITQVIDKLGLDEGVVRKAIGAVLAFFKTNVGEDFDFSSILEKLDGADKLMKEADDPLPPESQPRESSKAVGGIIALIKYILSVGPVMEILQKVLALFFGEDASKMIKSAGEGAELAGILNKLGISTEQGSKIMSMLIGFLKEKVDPETIDKLTEQVPAIKSFLGDTKKEE